MFNQNTFLIEYDTMKSALDWYTVRFGFEAKRTGILFMNFEFLLVFSRFAFNLLH